MPSWLTSSTMMHQLGGNLVDEASYKATYGHAGRATGDAVPGPTGPTSCELGGPQYTDSRTDFLAGKLATECSFGIWGIPQMKDAKIDYTVKPPPRFADAVSDNGFDAYAYYMMVNARSSRGDAEGCLDTGVRLFTDHAADLFTGAGLFVPRQEVMALPAQGRSNSAVFLDELKKAKFSPARRRLRSGGGYAAARARPHDAGRRAGGERAARHERRDERRTAARTCARRGDGEVVGRQCSRYAAAAEPTGGASSSSCRSSASSRCSACSRSCSASI